MVTLRQDSSRICFNDAASVLGGIYVAYFGGKRAQLTTYNIYGVTMQMLMTTVQG